MQVYLSGFRQAGQTEDLFILSKAFGVPDNANPGDRVLLDGDKVAEIGHARDIRNRDTIEGTRRLNEGSDRIFDSRRLQGLVDPNDFCRRHDKDGELLGIIGPLPGFSVFGIKVHKRHAGPVRRGLIPEIPLADLPLCKKAPGFECDRILFTGDDFQHHAAGVELIADYHHIGEDEGGDGQHSRRAAEALADDLRNGERLDVARTGGDKRQQNHPHKGSARQP